MEFVEDPHPADSVLGYDEPGGHYNYSQYQQFEKGAGDPVVQVMPGQAKPTFKQKVGALDNPGVKLPDLKNAALVPSKVKDGDGVEQVKEAKIKRQLYEITIGAKISRGSPPAVLDTLTIKKQFYDKGIGAFQFGETDDDSERFKELAKYWVLNSLIWVCAIEKGRLGATFYSHVGRVGKFHHSSFTSGGALLAAGEWVVEDGVLKKISGNSGHYRPTTAELHRAVMFMSSAWTQDTEVMLYNIRERNWEYVPVSVFKGDPTGGGKYRAHAAGVA